MRRPFKVYAINFIFAPFFIVGAAVVLSGALFLALMNWIASRLGGDEYIIDMGDEDVSK